MHYLIECRAGQTYRKKRERIRYLTSHEEGFYLGTKSQFKLRNERIFVSFQNRHIRREFRMVCGTGVVAVMK
jgi:hypothetical protein